MFFHLCPAAGPGAQHKLLLLHVRDSIRHYILRRTSHGFGSFFFQKTRKTACFSYDVDCRVYSMFRDCAEESPGGPDGG